jgi:D-glycero-D-manno-heptose 1,7-bisphosphate phosphatase
MKQRAVFLDRDGTINQDIGYLYRQEDFQFIPNAPEAIKLLNDHLFKTIVITNQAGVARGFYQEGDVLRLHEFINQKLRKYDANIDAFYFCPHHPIAGVGQYRVDCDCRKPKPGLILKAAKEHNLDLAQSFMIGDKMDDIRAGINAGVKGLLVKTGYGKQDTVLLEDQSLIFDSLYEAANYICKLMLWR